MLNESQQKPKPRRQHGTHKKKTQDETNDIRIEIGKGKEEKKMKLGQHQQRKKEDSRQGEYTSFRLARSARGL